MGLRLLLDTNIRCDYAKRVQETIDTIVTIVTYGEYVYIPSVVIGEPAFGFMKGKRRHFNGKKLQQVINRLEIQTIDVNEYIARVSGGPFSKKFLMSGKTDV